MRLGSYVTKIYTKPCTTVRCYILAEMFSLIADLIRPFLPVASDYMRVHDNL